jgi:NADH-quinone oxidoreductase subunit G
MLKLDGEWQTAEWQDVLVLVAERLKAAGGDGLGALVAPSATLEEMYLAQKVVRGLGGNNIDTRLRQQDFRGDAADASLPWLGVPIAELQDQQALLLIGTDIRQEQPLLAHRIRKAALAGAHVAMVNPVGLTLTFASTQYVDHPAGMLKDLAGIAKALGKRGSGTIKDLLADAKPEDTHRESASLLKAAGEKGRALILLGGLADVHPDYCLLKALAQVIADATKARVGFLPAAANSVGAHLAGALPHVAPGAQPVQGPGMPAAKLLELPRKAYLLWGIEPAYDLGNPAQAAKALDKAEFVVACAAHRSPSLDRAADVLLPIAGYAETSGTLVNADATWQSFRGAVAPPGEARPGWKLLRVLGNLLDLSGFEQNSSAEVLKELRTLCEGAKPDNRPRGDLKVETRGATDGLTRIGMVPIYAVDSLVRRAPALQRMPSAGAFGVFMSESEAAAKGLAEGDAVEVRQNGSAVKARLDLDDAVPAGCVRIPAGVAGSEALGDQIGAVSVTKV